MLLEYVLINFNENYRYIEGSTLYEAFLEQDGLTEVQLSQIFKSLIQCLSICHNNNFIHTDIKPQNIFIPKTN